MKKILIILSHPKKESLTHSIKEAFIRGLKRFDVELRVFDLHEEGFDPILHDREENDRDPTTLELQKNVKWADWLVFITPLWWNHVPAMLKGFFDRVFTENFAFEYNQAEMPVGLLDDKRALLICTSDTPPVFLRLSGGRRGLKAVTKGILGFCGIKESKIKLFGSVLRSHQEKKVEWLRRAERLGEEIGKPESVLIRFKRGLSSLVNAVRLPLYSLAFVSILLGASFGASMAGGIHWLRFALAAFIGLLAHAAVSFSNEVADESIDRVNTNRTMFNGGTGLLARGLVTRSTLSFGWVVSALAALIISGVLVFVFQYHWLLLFGLVLALFLGLEYSLPPLRLSRIGVGEIGAFIAYGVPLMLIGSILQLDGSLVPRLITDYRFYLLSLTVSLSVFVTLSLTQIPDTDADSQNGKRSISVLLKPQRVMIVSVFATLTSVFVFVALFLLDILTMGYALAATILPVLTALMILTNLDAYKVPAGMRMINIMGMAVTSTVYCTVVPSIYFLTV